MLIDASFAQLHNPLFLGGTNLGEKLDPAKKTGLKLKYDTTLDKLFVMYNGKLAVVPSSNVSSVLPTDPTDLGVIFDEPHVPPVSRVVTQGAPMVANVSRTAQVETPMSKPPTAPGVRPPKFQGLEK